VAAIDEGTVLSLPAHAGTASSGRTTGDGFVWWLETTADATLDARRL
jgi:hypothetical protein